MNTIGNRFAGSMVNRLAEYARRETLPNPKTSAQVMARIREAKASVEQAKSDTAVPGSCDRVEFSSLLAAQLKKHSAKT
jgi:hypothetical protein